MTNTLNIYIKKRYNFLFRTPLSNKTLTKKKKLQMNKQNQPTNEQTNHTVDVQ